MIYDLWDRIRFATEEAWLWILDARDRIAGRPGLLIAALALLAGILALIVFLLAASEGEQEDGTSVATDPEPTVTQSEPPPEAAPTPLVDESQIVDDKRFTIALPSGWTQTKGPKGAAFAASSDDGFARTILWIDRDPELDFDEFVDQSLAGLERLGENAELTDLVEGPTLETSIAELQADVPHSGGQPGPYRVTLRAAGELRFYLATSIAGGAPAARLADAELIGTTFRPQVDDATG